MYTIDKRIYIIGLEVSHHKQSLIINKNSIFLCCTTSPVVLSDKTTIYYSFVKGRCTDVCTAQPSPYVNHWTFEFVICISQFVTKTFSLFSAPGSKIVSLLPAAASINYLLLRLSLSFSNKSYLFLDVIRKNFLVISLLYFQFQNREVQFLKEGSNSYSMSSMQWLSTEFLYHGWSINLSLVYHLLVLEYNFGHCVQHFCTLLVIVSISTGPALLFSRCCQCYKLNYVLLQTKTGCQTISQNYNLGQFGEN